MPCLLFLYPGNITLEKVIRQFSSSQKGIAVFSCGPGSSVTDAQWGGAHRTAHQVVLHGAGTVWGRRSEEGGHAELAGAGDGSGNFPFCGCYV